MNTLTTTLTRLPLSEEDVEGVAVDLWGTVAGSRANHEPLDILSAIIGVHGKVDSAEFVRLGNRVIHSEPAQYLQHIASCYGVFDLPSDALTELHSLIRREKQNLYLFFDAFKMLARLKAKGKKMALVTNSPWPCSVHFLLERCELAQFFDAVIISSEVGLAKQDGPAIYALAAEKLGLAPSKCCSIGDKWHLDGLPAMEAGFSQVFLLDRSEKQDQTGHLPSEVLLDPRVQIIRTLDEVY